MVPGHGEADHGFGGGGQGFVVAGRSAMVHEMAEGSLDHPASGRHGETFGGEIAGDGLGVDAQGGGVLDEAREMAATGPGLRAVGCSVRTWPNRRVPAMGVLHARVGDGDSRQQAEGVGGDAALAALGRARDGAAGRSARWTSLVPPGGEVSVHRLSRPSPTSACSPGAKAFRIYQGPGRWRSPPASSATPPL